MRKETTLIEGKPTEGPYVVSQACVKYDHIGHYMEGILIKDAEDTTAIAEICGALPPLEAIGNATLLVSAANATYTLNAADPVRAARAIVGIVRAAQDILIESHETDGEVRRVSQEKLERLDMTLRDAGIEVELPISMLSGTETGPATKRGD